MILFFTLYFQIEVKSRQKAETIFIKLKKIQCAERK